MNANAKAIKREVFLLLFSVLCLLIGYLFVYLLFFDSQIVMWSKLLSVCSAVRLWSHRHRCCLWTESCSFFLLTFFFYFFLPLFTSFSFFNFCFLFFYVYLSIFITIFIFIQHRHACPFPPVCRRSEVSVGRSVGVSVGEWVSVWASPPVHVLARPPLTHLVGGDTHTRHTTLTALHGGAAAHFDVCGAYVLTGGWWSGWLIDWISMCEWVIG